MRRRGDPALLRLRRPATAATAALTLLCFASACTQVGGGDVGAPATTTPPPTTQRATTTTTAPAPPPVLDWQPCDGIECATLVVPLDHEDPSAGSMELAVARRPASDPEERIGSVLVNPGGPGGSGVDLVSSSMFDEALGDRFDVVGWDPRGAGASTPVDCGDADPGVGELDPSPDTPEEVVALESAAAEFAAACAAGTGELLAHLDTGQTVQDVELLRRALGEEQISFLGFSYGTLIGQMYAQRYGQHVRAMALDGVVDPAADLDEMLTGQAVAADAAMGSVPGLTESFERVRVRVESSPLPSRVGSPVGPATLDIAAFAATYLPGGMSRLSSALNSASGGDGTGLAVLAAVYTGALESLGGYMGVSCVDSEQPRGAVGWAEMAAAMTDAAPLLGAAVANELLSCAFWAEEPARQARAVRSTRGAPVLLVSNTGDVATPYSNAVVVAARLPGASLLTVEIDGHTAFGTQGCATEVVEAFLVDLVLPEPGVTC